MRGKIGHAVSPLGHKRELSSVSHGSSAIARFTDSKLRAIRARDAAFDAEAEGTGWEDVVDVDAGAEVLVCAEGEADAT